MNRIRTMTGLGFRDQLRRPLLIVLIVGLPFFFITRAIASTQTIPKTITLPGGEQLLTNMRDLHGASMAAITVAFVAGLCGAFVMRSSRSIDQRLVVAGFRPMETIIPRLWVLVGATALILTVSVIVTGLSFTPHSWAWFAVGNLLIGLTYASIGAICGALLGELGATYAVLFLAMLGTGILQNPMFGDPSGVAQLFPDYGAGRVIIDGCFGEGFRAWPELALAFGWLIVLGVGLVFTLSRSLGVRVTRRQSLIHR